MTRIYIYNHGWVNVKEGTTFPINISVQDVMDIKTINSNYSKSITLVGDKETSTTLGKAFDVNVTKSSFNVNKKMLCFVEQDSRQIFTDVFFQLTKIHKYSQTTPNDDDLVEYVGIIKSNITSLYDEIKNKELDELKIFSPSDYEELTKANIKAKYNATYLDKWKYHLTGTGGKNTDITVKQFRPSIFLKTYWDAIHESAGYSYNISDADAIKFNELVIPFSGVYQPSETTKEQSRVFGVDTTFYQHSISNNLEGYTANGANRSKFDPKLLQNLNISQDIYSQWNTTFRRMTANFTSEYNVSISVGIDVILDNLIANNIQLWNGGNGATLTFKVNLTIQKFPNALATSPSANYYTNELTITIPEGQLYPSGLNTLASGSFNFVATVPMVSGESLEFSPTLKFGSSDVNADNKFRDTVTLNDVGIGMFLNITSTTFNIQPQLEYNVGSPIYLQDFVPKGIKQRDFVKGIIDMFKLIPEVDESDKNKINYKIRDNFYDDGVQKNWTEKWAKDKQSSLEFIQDKQAKILNFTYSDDDDVWNSSYKASTKKTYGRYKYTFGNEYNKGEQDLKVVFSPTPIVTSLDNRNLYVPAIGSMNSSAEKRNIRILLDNGVRTDGNFKFLDDNGSTSTDETDYPFAAHWDDPINPSFDLNFGVSEYYFYDNYVTTFNNLYRLYHARSVGQLSKGKILTAYFDLTPSDIANFDLSDKIWVKDALYNVNKIIDYDANSDSLTKVELITVDDGVTSDISFDMPPTRPGASNPIIGLPYSEFNGSEVSVANSFGGGNITSIVQGEKNVLQPNTQALVYGNNNKINKSNSIIIGNDNNDDIGKKLLVGDGIESDDFNDAIIGNLKTDSLTTFKMKFPTTPFFSTVIVDIGEWDMQATNKIQVSHKIKGVGYQEVVHCSAIIIADDENSLFNLGERDAGHIKVIQNDVVLERKAGGIFDSVDYNDTTINRGYIYINYLTLPE